MVYSPIEKPAQPEGITCNLDDYERVRASFSWQQAWSELGEAPGGGFNIGWAAADRHAQGESGSRIAIRWLGEDDSCRDISYRELTAATNRFANLLDGLDIKRGETVFSLTGRIPLLYISALGTAKHLSMFCPLFEAFGPEPLLQRLRQGEARVLVTTRHHFDKKIAPIRGALPNLRHILLVDVDDHLEAGVWSLPCLLAQTPDVYAIPRTSPDDPALLHFTSGTTSMPKGVVHVHGAAVAHYISAKYVLDLHPGDIFWCTADPGWVMGTSYTIIAPLVHGVTVVVDEAEFSAARWLNILATQRVNVLYTSPTAIRRLMRLPTEQWPAGGFPSLRAIHSAGEPLDAEAVIWGERVLGLPIHDNWWQTETGAIMIANYQAMPIRPGSMGRPLPGITAAVVRTSKTAAATRIDSPDTVGMLALAPDWPSMFTTYLHDEARYRRSFSGGWYLTGDLARVDADGYFWFVGRANDMIKTAGHLVGPFEVESALDSHPAVAEAGVFGRPHPMLGEQVTACVVVKAGFTADERLRDELIGFGRRRLGSAVAPREIFFVHILPKTRSGKILRRLLRARIEGEPEGDISTLDSEESDFPRP